MSFPISSHFLHTPPPHRGTRALLPGMRASWLSPLLTRLRVPGLSVWLHGSLRGGRSEPAGPCELRSASPHRPPQAEKGNAREGRREPACRDPQLGALRPRAAVSHPCVRVPLRVLCPSVCARMRTRDCEASSPSTEIRAPPKQETGVFLPPPPQPVFPLFFLPPATHARFRNLGDKTSTVR